MQDEVDKPKDECGIFGIYAPRMKGIAQLVYYGLYALQHRGQESAGLAISSGEGIDLIKDMGLVPFFQPVQKQSWQLPLCSFALLQFPKSCSHL